MARHALLTLDYRKSSYFGHLKRLTSIRTPWPYLRSDLRYQSSCPKAIMIAILDLDPGTGTETWPQEKAPCISKFRPISGIC